MANSSSWQVGVIRVAQFGAAMAIVLWPAGGWAQSEGPAVFSPTIEQRVDARLSPAKVTSEEDSALTSKGYVRIGTISASQPGKKTDAEVTKQLESAILQKAAEAGGDVVRFSKEGAIETTDVPTGKTKTKRKCEEFKTNSITTGQNCMQSCHTDSAGNTMCINTLCSPKTMNATVCVRWGEAEETPVTKRENSLVSDGTVWRYDPKLAADIARAAEAARGAARQAEADKREAARKAEAAEKAFAPLEERLSHGQYAEAELLLAQGADVNASENGWTHLQRAAVRDDSRKEVEFLLAHGADVNAAADYGWTPLHWVVSKEVAEVLLAHGANVNAKNGYGATPLHYAVGAGRRGVAELLLAHGADVNATDNNGRTPLGLAEKEKNKEIVDLLRQQGGHE